MIIAKIVWDGAGEQQKSFEDLSKALEWCRRNHKKIICINNYFTQCLLRSDSDLVRMLLEKGEK